MKLIPAATARSSTACEVASSEPTLCMNDFSSASPNVIAPRHRVETFTPDDPRFLYFICVTSANGSIAVQTVAVLGTRLLTPRRATPMTDVSSVKARDMHRLDACASGARSTMFPGHKLPARPTAH